MDDSTKSRIVRKRQVSIAIMKRFLVILDFVLSFIDL